MTVRHMRVIDPPDRHARNHPSLPVIYAGRDDLVVLVGDAAQKTCLIEQLIPEESTP
jgi:hypothetical protein